MAQKRNEEQELAGGAGRKEQKLELAGARLELVLHQDEVAGMLEVKPVEAVQPGWQLEIVVLLTEVAGGVEETSLKVGIESENI